MRGVDVPTMRLACFPPVRLPLLPKRGRRHAEKAGEILQVEGEQVGPSE